MAFVLQTSVFPFMPFLAVSPNLLLIVVFVIGFLYGEKEGSLYGIMAGVLMDVFYSGPFGYFTLIFGWIGFMNGFFSRYYFDEYIFLPIAMCGVNEVVYNLLLFTVRYILRRKTDFGYYLKTIILPEIMLTIIFALLLYRPLLTLNAWLKRLDETKKGNKLVQ